MNARNQQIAGFPINNIKQVYGRIVNKTNANCWLVWLFRALMHVPLKGANRLRPLKNGYKVLNMITFINERGYNLAESNLFL